MRVEIKAAENGVMADILGDDLFNHTNDYNHYQQGFSDLLLLKKHVNVQN